MAATGAAWLAGRAIAQTWRPWWSAVAYMLILGLAVRFFHYALFANTYGTTTSSGLSRGIPAHDLIVTLGGWSTPGGHEASCSLNWPGSSPEVQPARSRA